ncbi:MAG TPA: site-specific DNA-methyltransferase [Candidatus Angelobacter sp.]|jgi:site-specific DNA-methyltransferase (adenine-specific)|nr:site-specific DNA-methyltransferase [Candidatus Angelobacter sp.]
MRLAFETRLGQLYEADCTDFLQTIPSGSVHTFFADPPFNLGKQYGKKGSDARAESEYLKWSFSWLEEAVRILAPGGALFVYNLPKWLIAYGAFLNSQRDLTFKHWVAIDKAHSLPIPGRLSPSHYGMLYYIKGAKPRVFDRDAVRIPIAVCRHCKKDIKDYGGHKKYLNPKGLNLTDVWDDIPPVRHRKYKYRTPNELAPQIVERVILLTTRIGDLVCDPFVGGGTTAYVAERLGRKWTCADLNTVSAAIRRLSDLENGVHPLWKSSAAVRPESGDIINNLPLFR